MIEFNTRGTYISSITLSTRMGEMTLRSQWRALELQVGDERKRWSHWDEAERDAFVQALHETLEEEHQALIEEITHARAKDKALSKRGKRALHHLMAMPSMIEQAASLSEIPGNTSPEGGLLWTPLDEWMHVPERHIYPLPALENVTLTMSAQEIADRAALMGALRHSPAPWSMRELSDETALQRVGIYEDTQELLSSELKEELLSWIKIKPQRYYIHEINPTYPLLPKNIQKRDTHQYVVARRRLQAARQTSRGQHGKTRGNAAAFDELHQQNKHLFQGDELNFAVLRSAHEANITRMLIDLSDAGLRDTACLQTNPERALQAARAVRALHGLLPNLSNASRNILAESLRENHKNGPSGDLPSELDLFSENAGRRRELYAMILSTGAGTHHLNDTSSVESITGQGIDELLHPELLKFLHAGLSSEEIINACEEVIDLMISLKALLRAPAGIPQIHTLLSAGGEFRIGKRASPEALTRSTEALNAFLAHKNGGEENGGEAENTAERPKENLYRRVIPGLEEVAQAMEEINAQIEADRLEIAELIEAQGYDAQAALGALEGEEEFGAPLTRVEADITRPGEQSWTLRVLRNAALLRDEGSALKHCVGWGSYALQASNGKSVLLSLRRAGVRHLTAELRADTPKKHAAGAVANGHAQQQTAAPIYRIAQAHGAGNRLANAEERAALLAWCAQANIDPGALLYDEDETSEAPQLPFQVNLLEIYTPQMHSEQSLKDVASEAVAQLRGQRGETVRSELILTRAINTMTQRYRERALEQSKFNLDVVVIHEEIQDYEHWNGEHATIWSVTPPNREPMAVIMPYIKMYASHSTNCGIILGALTIWNGQYALRESGRLHQEVKDTTELAQVISQRYKISMEHAQKWANQLHAALQEEQQRSGSKTRKKAASS